MRRVAVLYCVLAASGRAKGRKGEETSLNRSSDVLESHYLSSEGQVGQIERQ